MDAGRHEKDWRQIFPDRIRASLAPASYFPLGGKFRENFQ
jgi:hypothetical protein